MSNDPAWFREEAQLWRDMAEMGNPEQRDARLKLADEFDAMAAKLEAKKAPDTL